MSEIHPTLDIFSDDLTIDKEDGSELIMKAKNVKNRLEVFDICSKAYQMCRDKGEEFDLSFPGFQIKIHLGTCTSLKKIPEIVLIGGMFETHYTPINEIKLIDYLSRKIN